MLGTDVGGIGYLLGIGEPVEAAGWTVEPDAAALAEALPIARAGAAAVAPAARKRYLQAFHPDVVTRRLIEIYTSLIENSHPSPR
nr:hypothetical protein GCM10020092_003700 [Actinoplanes digitatis]